MRFPGFQKIGLPTGSPIRPMRLCDRGWLRCQRTHKALGFFSAFSVALEACQPKLYIYSPAQQQRAGRFPERRPVGKKSRLRTQP